MTIILYFSTYGTGGTYWGLLLMFVLFYGVIYYFKIKPKNKTEIARTESKGMSFKRLFGGLLSLSLRSFFNHK